MYIEESTRIIDLVDACLLFLGEDLQPDMLFQQMLHVATAAVSDQLRQV